MPSDPDLFRALKVFVPETFSGEVFRVTLLSTHALTPSVSGGRWAPPASPGVEVPILYTSLEKDGALAEVASYLAKLTPIPGARNLKVTRVLATTAKPFASPGSNPKGSASTCAVTANVTICGPKRSAPPSRNLASTVSLPHRRAGLVTT